MKNKFKIKSLNDADRFILKFLWRWKLSTTAALAEKFFTGKSKMKLAYKRLLRLQNGGFIAWVPDTLGQNFYWTLQKPGFAVVVDGLGLLREKGFKSEHISHDALASAFHMGEWLTGVPKGGRIYSEQQLRRLDSEEYPDWIPKSLFHRPDGYWGVPVNSKTLPIALEVELSRKSKRKYEEVADFYSDEESILKVIWVVSSIHFAKSIQRYAVGAVRTRANIHNYIFIGDALTLGWNAPIALGPDRGKTFLQLINHYFESAGYLQGKQGEPVLFHTLLNQRKSFYKTKALEKDEKPENPLLTTL